MIKRTLKAVVPVQMRRQFHNWRAARQRANGLVAELVDQYCKGEGLEIGPGKNPYGPRNRTKTLDKHTSNKDGTPSPDFIGDASNIPEKDSAFDFVISAHCLEHVPNTIRTLNEWLRVLRPGGSLLLVLPHADRTFDRHRAKTKLAHHIEDFQRLGDAGSDPSHFEEIKQGWSKNSDHVEQSAIYEKEWGAPVWDFDFRVKNDVLHYHVWTQSEMVDVLRYLGLQVLYVRDEVPERYDSFVIVARKVMTN